MYKLKNIANDRFKGVLYKHVGHFGAQMTPHSLRLEPLIADKLMRIGTEAYITDADFVNCKDVIDTHVNGHVLEITKISDDAVAPSAAPAKVVVIEEPPVVEVKVEEIVPTVVEEIVEPAKDPEPIKEPEVVVDTKNKKTGKKDR